jgi:hypothetical protein
MEPVAFEISTVFAVAIGLWAGVIAWLGKGILNRLDSTASSLQDYIVQTEARLAVVEDRLDIL